MTAEYIVFSTPNFQLSIESRRTRWHKYPNKAEKCQSSYFFVSCELHLSANWIY